LDSLQKCHGLLNQKAKSWVMSNIIEAIAQAGTKDQQAPSQYCGADKTAGLAPSSTLEETPDLLMQQLKKTFKEVLGDGKRKWVNMG
jgi:hypothetical protein